MSSTAPPTYSMGGATLSLGGQLKTSQTTAASTLPSLGGGLISKPGGLGLMGPAAVSTSGVTTQLGVAGTTASSGLRGLDRVGANGNSGATNG